MPRKKKHQAGIDAGKKVLSGRRTCSMFTRWGVAKLVKAPDFDSGMRRFESFFPSPHS
jgi:hypothetical protein